MVLFEKGYVSQFPSGVIDTHRIRVPVMLHEIINGLKSCLASRDVHNSGAYFCDQLHEYLDLRYPLQRTDRVTIATLLYDLMTLPVQIHISSTSISGFSRAFVRVVKHFDKFNTSTDNEQRFTLDWKPLYQLLCHVFYPLKSTNDNLGETVIWSARHAVISACQKSRKYFDLNAAGEILDLMKPIIDNTSTNDDVLFEAVGILALMIPTRRGVFKGIDAFLKWSLNLWDRIEWCTEWDSLWMTLLGRMAKHWSHLEQPLPDLIGPEGIYRVFTRYMGRIPNLVVASSNQIPTPAPRHVPSSSKMMYHLSKYTGFAQFVVYSIGDENVRRKFTELMTSISSLYYPSNVGSWSGGQGAFMLHLCYHFAKRCKNETLQHGIRSEIVHSVMPSLQWGMFSKNYVMQNSCFRALSHVLTAEPSLTMKPMLLRVFDALQSVNETHQTTAALHILTASVRVLLHPERWLDLNEDSMEIGADYLVQLLHMALPAIDPNDDGKTKVVFAFFTDLLSWVPISEGPVNGESSIFVSVMTHLQNSISDWAILLVDHLLNWVLKKDTSSRRVAIGLLGLSDQSESSGGANPEFQRLVEVLAMQMSPSVLEIVSRRVARFIVDEHAASLEGSIDDVAVLVGSFCWASPDTIMKEWVPIVYDSVIDGYTDSGKIMIRILLRSLAAACRKAGVVIVDYWSQLCEIIRLICPGLIHSLEKNHAPRLEAETESERLLRCSGLNLLQSVLEGLTQIYPLEFRISADLWSFDKAWSSVNKTYSLEELNVSWHVPNAKEIVLVKEIADIFFAPCIDTLANWSESANANLTAFERHQLISTVGACVRGLGSFFWDKGDCIPSGVCLSSLFEKPNRVPNLVSLTQTLLYLNQNEEPIISRSRVVTVLNSVCEVLQKSFEDDTASLKELSGVYCAVLGHAGVTSSELQRESRMEKAQRDRMRDGYSGRAPTSLPRPVVIARLVTLFRTSVLLSSQYGTAVGQNPWKKCIQLLSTLALAPYPSVRDSARTALSTYLSSAPFPVGDFIATELIKELEELKDISTQGGTSADTVRYEARLVGVLESLAIPFITHSILTDWLTLSKLMEILHQIMHITGDISTDVQTKVFGLMMSLVLLSSPNPISGELPEVKENDDRVPFSTAAVRNYHSLRLTQAQKGQKQLFDLTKKCDNGGHWWYSLLQSVILNVLGRAHLESNPGTYGSSILSISLDMLLSDVSSSNTVAKSSIVGVISTLFDSVFAPGSIVPPWSDQGHVALGDGLFSLALKRSIDIPSWIPESIQARGSAYFSLVLDVVLRGLSLADSEAGKGRGGGFGGMIQSLMSSMPSQMTDMVQNYMSRSSAKIDSGFSLPLGMMGSSVVAEHAVQYLCRQPRHWPTHHDLPRTQTNDALFSPQRAGLIFWLVRVLDPAKSIELLWPSIEILLNSENSTTQQQSIGLDNVSPPLRHCVLAEVLAGMTRAALVFWSVETYEEFLNNKLKPAFEAAYSRAGPESYAEWGMFVRFIGDGQPSALIWLWKRQMNDLGDTSLNRLKHLYLIHMLLLVSNPHILKDQSLLILKEVLPPKQNDTVIVRREIADVVVLILSKADKECCERILEYVVSGLKAVAGSIDSTLVNAADVSLRILTRAIETGYAVQIKSVIPSILIDVAKLSTLEDKNRSIGDESRKCLAYLAQCRCAFPQDVRTVIDACKSVLNPTGSSDSWKTLSGVLSFLKIFVNNHRPLLTQTLFDEVRSICVKCTHEQNPEVSELSREVLSSFFVGENEYSKVSKFVEDFQGRDGSVGELRAKALGLAALVESHPYDIPDWLPSVISLLTVHARSKYPSISGVARRAVASFRRTHQDAWKEHVSQFNQEQREDLSDVLLDGSYIV